MVNRTSAAWRRQAGGGHLLDRLNRVEFKVLQQLTIDASNEEIAHRLYVSRQAVQNHVLQILEKLELETRGEAARLARQNGLRAM